MSNSESGSIDNIEPDINQSLDEDTKSEEKWIDKFETIDTQNSLEANSPPKMPEKSLREVRSKYECEIALLKQENEMLKLELSECQKDKEESQKLYSQIIASFNETNESNNEDDINKIKEVYEREKIEITQKHDEEIRFLKDDYSAVLVEKEEYEKLYRDCQHDLNILQLKYDNDSAENNNEKVSLEQKLDQLESTLQKTKEQYQEEIESYKRKCDEKFNKSLSEFETQIRQIKDEYEAKLKETELSFQNQKELLHGKIENLGEINHSLNYQIDEIQKGYDDTHKNEQIGLQKEIDELRENLKKVKNRAKNDIEYLKADNLKLWKDLSNTKKNYNELNNELIKNKQRLKNTKDKVDKNSNLKALNEEYIKQFKQEMQEKELIIHDLQSDMQREWDKTKNLEIEVREHKDQLMKYSKKHQDYKQKIVALEHKNMKLLNMYEKYKNDMIKKWNAYDEDIKVLESKNYELLNENRLLQNHLLINNLSKKGIINQNNDDNLKLKVSKSQVDINNKVSETMIYKNQDDDSLLIQPDKIKHIRRSSSVSSVQRVKMAHDGDFETENSPSHHDNILDQSRITKSYWDYSEGDEINNPGCMPERDLSTSYLDDDYDSAHLPLTHRNIDNAHRYKREISHAQYNSRVAAQTIQDQNNATGVISKNYQNLKSKSSKRNLPKKREDLSHVLSPADSKNTKYNDISHLDENEYSTENIQKYSNDKIKSFENELHLIQNQVFKFRGLKNNFKTNTKRGMTDDIIDHVTHNNTFDENYSILGVTQNTEMDKNKTYINHNYEDDNSTEIPSKLDRHDDSFMENQHPNSYTNYTQKTMQRMNSKHWKGKSKTKRTHNERLKLENHNSIPNLRQQ